MCFNISLKGFHAHEHFRFHTSVTPFSVQLKALQLFVTYFQGSTVVVDGSCPLVQSAIRRPCTNEVCRLNFLCTSGHQIFILIVIKLAKEKTESDLIAL